MEQSNGFMDKLARLIKDFSMSKFMPKLDSILGWIELITRLAVMAAPVVVLIMGLIYFFIPPKEANHSLGYRFYWGMGSVDAWRFTQKIAGLSWSVVGLVMSLVMFLITNGYRGMELMAMTRNAAICLLWQIGILAVLCLLIDLVVLLRYDWKGNVRPKTIIRVPDNFLEFRKRPDKPGKKTEKPQEPAAEPAPEFVEPLAAEPVSAVEEPYVQPQPEAFAAAEPDGIVIDPSFFAAPSLEEEPLQPEPAVAEAIDIDPPATQDLDPTQQSQ